MEHPARQRVATITCSLACFGVVACGGDSLPTGPIAPLGEDRIKLEAVVSSASGSCPERSFRLGAITVRTSSATDFDLPCAQVVAGTAVEVNGAEISGNFLFAHEVEPDDDALGDAEFEVRGPIGSLGSVDACTATGGRSVTVLGLRFFVGTFFTEFDDIAQGCGGLTTGQVIRANGNLPPSEPLRASEVQRQ